jgi:RNA-directed DNA polymerase
MVIVVEAHRRHDWLLHAVEQRLREALAVRHVTLNAEQSRMVDVARGETLSFLGFDFRRLKSRRGVWRPRYTPRQKKRTALLRKLKEIFRRDESQPVARGIALMNPILRGWVRSFAVGDSSRCFGFMKDWVEKQVRRHLMRARNRKGLGWQRGRRQWFYGTLRLLNNYRVSRPQPKALPVR